MNRVLLVSIVVIILNPAFAQSSYDSLSMDSLKQGLQTKMLTYRGYKEYKSDLSWWNGQPVNALSSINSQVSSASSNDYLSSITSPSISFRRNSEAMVIMNGVPMNVYDLTSGTSNGLLGHVSSWDISDVSLVKGSQKTSMYGGLASNGLISLNSTLSQSKGLSVGFNSGYVHQYGSVNDLASNLFRNGINVGYGWENVKTSLGIEHLKNYHDIILDQTKLDGYNLSSNTQLSISDELSTSLFLNYFHYNNNSSQNTDNTNRLMGSFNVHYKIADFLSFDLGGSILDIDQAEKFKYLEQIGTISDIQYINNDWKQSSYHLSTKLEKNIFPRLRAEANIGVRKLYRRQNYRSEYFSNVQNGGSFNISSPSIVPALYSSYGENQLLLTFGDVTFIYSKTITAGISISRELDSALPEGLNSTYYPMLYSSLDFTRLLGTNKKIFSGVLQGSYLRAKDKYSSYDFGIDLNVKEDFIVLSLTRFHNTSSMLVSRQISGAVGYLTINSGTLESINKGFEIDLYVSPLKNWRMNVGWFKISSTAKIQQYPQNPTPFGTVLLPYNGNELNTSSTSEIDDVYPDWIMNVNNSFSYKNFEANLTLTYRRGGEIYNSNYSYGRYTGVLEETMLGSEGGILGVGVIDNGDGTFSPNDGTPSSWDNQFDNNPFWNYLPAESAIEDGTSIALRNISVRYTFEELLKLKSVSIGIAAQNIWSNSKLPNNQIPSDGGITNTLLFDKSFSIELKAKF